MDRRSKLLFMKDILDHMQTCFDEWQAADGSASSFLADSIDRDLNEFRRMCHSLRGDATSRERCLAAC
jgi:hypothetical protein